MYQIQYVPDDKNPYITCQISEFGIGEYCEEESEFLAIDSDHKYYVCYDHKEFLKAKGYAE